MRRPEGSDYGPLVTGLLLGILLTFGLGHGSVAAQDLTSPHEMVLQGDRLMAAGRPCLAAERYRAVVGELPGVFLRYARARSECLAGGDD